MSPRKSVSPFPGRGWCAVFQHGRLLLTRAAPSWILNSTLDWLVFVNEIRKSVWPSYMGSSLLIGRERSRGRNTAHWLVRGHMSQYYYCEACNLSWGKAQRTKLSQAYFYVLSIYLNFILFSVMLFATEIRMSICFDSVSCHWLSSKYHDASAVQTILYSLAAFFCSTAMSPSPRGTKDKSPF